MQLYSLAHSLPGHGCLSDGVHSVQIKTRLVLSGDKGVVAMLSSLFPDREEVAVGEQERWEAADPC